MDEEQDLEKTQQDPSTSNKENGGFPIEEYRSRNTREREGRRFNPNSPLGRRNATLKLRREEQFRRAQELGGGVPLDNTLNLSASRGVGESLNRENLGASTSAAQSEASRRNALPSRMQNYKPFEEEGGSKTKNKKLNTQGAENEVGQQPRFGANNQQISGGSTKGFRYPGQSQISQDTPDKFPFGTVFLMVGTAIFFDILQIILDLIPFVGWIISPIVGFMGSFTFFLWFKTKGVQFNKLKNAAALGGSFVFELVPILNALPAQTGVVLWIIGKEKAKKYIPALEKIDSSIKKAA